jgi:hypothetical protein
LACCKPCYTRRRYTSPPKLEWKHWELGWRRRSLQWGRRIGCQPDLRYPLILFQNHHLSGMMSIAEERKKERIHMLASDRNAARKNSHACK